MSRKRLKNTIRRRKNKKQLAIESLEAKVVLTAYGFAEAGVEWAYTFEGDAADDGGVDATSLDGTWSHENGSDQWDGSEIGDADALPGGVSALTDGDTSFIRVQDPGDPRDTLDAEEPSNRKVYFTHVLSEDTTEDTSTIVDDGVTLYFRARVATAATGPIDDLHPDDGPDSEPWPDEGIGYHQHNGGKSLIAIKQADGPNIAFGLDRGESVNEDLFGNEEGLTLPHLLVDIEPSDDSDPNNSPENLSADAGNIVAVDDVTEWQEFWITIQEGAIEVDGFEDGTHMVNVYSANGADPLEAQEFFITAALGSDVDGESYIALGAGATGRAGAFDIDFFSWAPGIHAPALNEGGGDPGADSEIELSGGTAAQSSQLGGFAPENALDDVANFTHTQAGDENPTWQVMLEDSYAFDSVTVFNRGASQGTLSCCPSRLRDITIQVVDFDGDVTADFTGGTVVSSSDLLNPENEIGGGTNTDGPISLTFESGGAVGNLIRVIRTVDDDLSGTDGEGNADEGSVLSIDLVSATGSLATTTTELQGDLDNDGAVGFTDFLLLSSTFGTTVDPAGSGADIDGDGTVGFTDFLILSNNFGKTAAAADAVFAQG